MKVILAGSFVAAMAAIIVSVYKKKRPLIFQGDLPQYFDEEETPPFSSLYEKFYNGLSEEENKLKEEGQKFSIPVGEFGLFL